MVMACSRTIELNLVVDVLGLILKMLFGQVKVAESTGELVLILQF